MRFHAYGAALLAVGTALAPCGLPAQSNAERNSDAVAASPPHLLTITLEEALRRAELNEPGFVAAAAEGRALALDRTNARAALLPTATYHNQVIYTEPNGIPGSRIGQVTNAPSPVFIANNAVREYASQGLFNETVGFAQVGAIRLADATAARAAAETEISRRGLVSSVVGLYYNLNSTQIKLIAADRARSEANLFLGLTQKREAAREAAHADVLKAQIQTQQREREYQDGQLALDRARLELAVLLFPDPTTSYQIETPGRPGPLPDRASVEAAARQNNPEIRSALASLQVSQADTYSARAALLPDLALNVTYGIDATQFGRNSIDPNGAQIRNLGYSGSVSLDIPVWDWLTSERRIKQSHIREAAAQVNVTASQRRLLANLSEFFGEADLAFRQLALLDESQATARESLRLTNLRYVDGESTALEVVDAQNALLTAELARVDGAARYQLALAQLQTLTGRL